jgi:hypothetical protein
MASFLRLSTTTIGRLALYSTLQLSDLVSSMLEFGEHSTVESTSLLLGDLLSPQVATPAVMLPQDVLQCRCSKPVKAIEMNFDSLRYKLILQTRVWRQSTDYLSHHFHCSEQAY